MAKLEERLKVMAKKYTILKSRYASMITINTEKDIKIQALQLKIPVKSKKTRNFLQIYRKVFSEGQIIRLEAIDGLSKNDSSFIRLIIGFIYSIEMDIPTLKTGLKHDRPKLPLEIIELITAMYSLRLQMYTDSDHDYILRIKKMNTHISNALNSLLQKK